MDEPPPQPPGASAPDRPDDDRSRHTIERGGEEFGRVLTFSDGLFAIAMTLLVVGIEVPTISSRGDEGQLFDALRELDSSFVSFFISFAVIGRYWIAHHQFFRLLGAMDYGLILLNLVYLALIAFLPFPTALLGTYFENPISVAAYAVSIAAVSGMEVVLLNHAHRHGLFERALPAEIYHWGVGVSLMPVAFFVASIPLAFFHTGLAVALWFGSIPMQALINRWKPPDTDAYLR